MKEKWTRPLILGPFDVLETLAELHQIAVEAARYLGIIFDLTC